MRPFEFVIPEHDEAGPGATAVQTISAGALTRGFTHLVIIPANPRPPEGAITRVIQAAALHPESVVLPSRQTGRNRVAAVVGTLGAWDAGLAVFPLNELRGAPFRLRGISGQFRLMARMLWRGVPLHLEPVADWPAASGAPRTRVRRGLMEAALLFIAQLRLHEDPRHVAAAFGLGVFVGCTPFFGFHLLLALGLSILLRLPFVYLCLGTQISNPLFATPLTIASISVGRSVLRAPAGASGFSAAWLVGASIVGAALGGAGAVGAYVVARQWRARGARHQLASPEHQAVP